MFAQIARRYDLNNRLHSLWRDQAWRRAAAKMARLRPGESALDVACGTGDLTAMLARMPDRVVGVGCHAQASVVCSRGHVSPTGHARADLGMAPGGRLVGVDFCPEMLEIARRKFPRLPIEWVQADAHALPFADASFDVITIAFGLRNLADPRRALAEFVRLLRPGGRLVVLEFAPEGCGWGGRAIAWFTRHVMSRTASIIAGERGGRAGKMPATHEGGTPSTHASAIAGEGGGAYDYLHKSVQSFLTPEKVAQEMARAGLTRIEIREMTFGTIAICRGVKE